MNAPIAWRYALGLLLAHGAFAVLTWFTLPPRIPTHFGPAGKPDAFAPASLFTWFAPAGASLFVYFLIYILSRPSAVTAWNIPEKERFLKLAPKQQAPVIEIMMAFGALSAGCTILVFLALHSGMFLTAHGYTKGMPWFILVLVYGLPGVLLLGLIPWSRAVKRSILEAG